MGKFAQIQDIDLLSTLSDFTSKENWDKFFTIRGSHDSFEWYAEWPQLKDPLLSVLNAAAESPESLQILVPGCGNSRLSEQLYDAGFRGITNIDFSKVVISDMLRRNVRDRPGMRWRVMDMTNMQFPDAAFDVVLDKGGLDALMEPEIGPKLGTQYLSEVKRVLKSGGKFICLTLAESHVLGLLFPKFRLGWRTTIHSISQKLSGRPRLNTFMVVVEKDSSSSLHDIVSDFQQSDIDCKQDQVQGLYTALEIENRIRKEYVDGSNIAYSLEDLQLGTKGDLMELHPGQRIYLALGGQGESNFRYKAVLLDAQSSSDPFLYHCGIFFVPKSRSHEWLFSSEEGQWMVVERSKAARLIMILLDSSHTNISMEEIQKDLSSLVKQLAPQKHDKGAQIPFMMAGDGIMHRTAVHQATSKLTGPIKVEDVIYENIEDHLASLFPSKELVFRRLTFERTEGLVQSEALLLKESASMTSGSEARKYTATSKAKKRKQKLKESKQSMTNDLTGDVDVDHTFLASSYHTGIIGGFSLVSSYLQSLATAGRMVEVIIIGLGAGLLPMFLRRCMPFLHLEVVELDPVVLNLARDWFGFQEDECLKVHLGDGIQFLKKHIKVIDCKKEETTSNVDLTCPNGSYVGSNINGEPTGKVDVVIIDVDSSDSSSGLSCPAADFIEDAFLIAVKEVLSEQGLFVVNVVSRSSSIKSTVISRMKKVFSHLYCLQLEEDVNEVLFAVNTNSDIENGDVAEAASQLEKLLKFEQPERSRVIMDAAKKIKYLK